MNRQFIHKLSLFTNLVYEFLIYGKYINVRIKLIVCSIWCWVLYYFLEKITFFLYYSKIQYSSFLWIWIDMSKAHLQLTNSTVQKWIWTNIHNDTLTSRWVNSPLEHNCLCFCAVVSQKPMQPCKSDIMDNWHSIRMFYFSRCLCMKTVSFPSIP